MGAEEVKLAALSKLDSLNKDYSLQVGTNKLDAYEREATNKGLTAIDAANKEIKAKTIDKLEKVADKGFHFILKELGLEKVNVSKFKPGNPLDAKSSDVGNDFRATDKGSYNMHTGDKASPPMSMLGTPVFCDMILGYRKTTVQDKGNFRMTTKAPMESIRLLNVVADVNLQTEVVKTKVQGVDGTVKTYMAEGDFVVTVRGIITNPFKQEYPKDEVAKLLKIVRQKKEIEVVSEYLSLFGIHSLVTDNIRMGQSDFKTNQQKFEFIFSSDTPLFLRKIKKRV